jgi:catechol 2,3-dioxygenase-like lactoylglutathione lyase family enzyme
MAHATTSRVDAHPFIKSVHGVRYHVKDVARSVTFYTQHLGFKVERQAPGRCRTVNVKSLAAGTAWC